MVISEISGKEISFIKTFLADSLSLEPSQEEQGRCVINFDMSSLIKGESELEYFLLMLLTIPSKGRIISILLPLFEV